jgi:DNA-binding LacI/PurR family transcriptional regulator
MIDVARAAGVSPATVSLVVNNRLGGNVRIPPETQQRVLAAAAALGYVADPVAQSLAGSRNGLLGLFTFDAIFPVQFRDFYYPFLVGVEHAAEELNYDLILFTSTGGGEGKRQIYRQGANRLRLADGAVLLGSEEDKGEVQRLVDEQYPFVFIGRRELPNAQVSFAAADYATATADMVDYLFGLGHRCIGYLGAETNTESLRDRRMGYRQAFARRGLPLDPNWMWPHVPPGAPGEAPVNVRGAQPAELPAVLTGWLRQGVTAILVETGPYLPQLLPLCAALGIETPRDLSVAFLGDLSIDLPWELEATTIAIPRQEMGAAAVRLLTELLAQEDAAALRQVTLPCRLVIGSSCATPRTDP